VAPIIRTFQFPEDYAGCAQVWKNSKPGVTFNQSDEPAEIIKKLAYSPELILVAEDGGRIIGTVIGGFDGRRGMIYHLAVLPEYQKQGTGKALLHEVEKRLQELGCLKAYLMVTHDNNTLDPYYENEGWHNHDVILMAKELG
jgi:ribosomal protein S18 acetylase RimI-like enzyme